MNRQLLYQLGEISSISSLITADPLEGEWKTDIYLENEIRDSFAIELKRLLEELENAPKIEISAS